MNRGRRSKHILGLLARSFLYSLILVPFTLLIVFLWTGALVRDKFVLLMFLEGGLGLLFGVIISLSNSPSISRTSEHLFNTSPWSREAEKHAQSVGLKWMTVSMFLVLIGIAVSAF